MMLFLERIKDSDKVGYFYTPNNHEGAGIIEINTTNGEVYIVKLSTYDEEHGSNFYANKARGKVKQLWDSGELPDEKFYAWG